MGSKEISPFLEDAVERGRAPGLVAIVAQRDHILYHQAFGKMDVANDVAMREDTIFRIASMTKPITATAVMMLIEAGNLSLDDPISNFIPSLRNPRIFDRFDKSQANYTTRQASREITVRHLLNQTSGFGYDFSNEILLLLQEKIGKQARELPLIHEPGNKWTYGMSPRILGELVEFVSGMALDRFFESRIFRPLSMNDTSYAVPAQKQDRLATQHQREDGAFRETPNPDRDNGTVRGDGELRSTGSDYIRFLQMFLNDGWHRSGRILSMDSVRLMTQNQIGELVVEKQRSADLRQARDFPLGAGRDKFGFGFQISTSIPDDQHERSPGSYSWAGMYNTHFWVDPSNGIAAVILMQVLPFYDDACMEILKGFEARVYMDLS